MTYALYNHITTNNSAQQNATGPVYLDLNRKQTAALLAIDAIAAAAFITLGAMILAAGAVSTGAIITATAAFAAGAAILTVDALALKNLRKPPQSPAAASTVAEPLPRSSSEPAAPQAAVGAEPPASQERLLFRSPSPKRWTLRPRYTLPQPVASAAAQAAASTVAEPLPRSNSNPTSRPPLPFKFAENFERETRQNF